MADEKLETLFQEAWNTYICIPESALNSGAFGQWLGERSGKVNEYADPGVIGQLVSKFLTRWDADEVA